MSAFPISYQQRRLRVLAETGAAGRNVFAFALTGTPDLEPR